MIYKEGDSNDMLSLQAATERDAGVCRFRLFANLLGRETKPRDSDSEIMIRDCVVTRYLRAILFLPSCIKGSHASRLPSGRPENARFVVDSCLCRGEKC